jgi:hypothetical protein
MMGAARKCGFPRMKLNSESMVRVAELDLSTRYHRPKRLDVGVRCLELTLPPLPMGLQRGSGSTEIQNARLITDMGAGRPTVSYMTEISTKRGARTRPRAVIGLISVEWSFISELPFNNKNDR